MRDLAKLSQFRLVLVGPMYAGNVGACARLAANFGIEDLWIVSPQCRWNGREAKLYAKGPALKYLERFQETKELSQALKGCTGAVGFTRRGGELRKASIALSQLATHFSSEAKVALVFGREDGGLTSEELLACTQVCSFKVSETMPSLNLSHAVGLVLGTLAEAFGSTAAMTHSEEKEKFPKASVDALEELFGHWRQAMLDAGIKHGGNPDRMLAHIRRVIQRAEITTRELSIFRGYISKTQVMMGTRKRIKN